MPDARFRTTPTKASPQRTWSRIVIPIVIAGASAVPPLLMFGDMLQNPRSFIHALMPAIGVFVAVGALPWFLYVSSRSKPDDQQSDGDAPEFSAESLVWRGSGPRGQPVSVIVDRAAGLIHFQNCVVRAMFLLGPRLRWFSCSLSDLRCFHESPMKHVTALVIKTDIGKLTVLFVSGDLQSLLQTLSEAVPGGRRRFHEDHPLAILLYLLAGFGAAVVALFLIPDRLPPNTALISVLGSGVAATLAARWAISVWSGTRTST